MRHLIQSVCLLVGLAPLPAWAHGNAIHVSPNFSGKLIVSGGIADGAGFADQIFVESGSDGDPQFPINIPYTPCSLCTVWNVPGFEISGMDEHSKLRLELLARPVLNASPAENRVLWYWNSDSDSQSLELPPAATTLYLRATGGLSTAISSSTLVAPPAMQIAEPVAADEGFHNHALLGYALSANPSSPAGAYGIFARLTSNKYAPSDPFLVVINHIDHLSESPNYAQILPAALAINAAAVDGLPGDFNRDGSVDALDYTVWRNNSRPPEDFTLWKMHYGDTTGGPGAGGIASIIPEPTCWAIVVGGLTIAALRQRRNH